MDDQVGVIGAGVMGHGIAETCAIAGYHVILCDVDDSILSAAIEKIRWSLKSLLDRGMLKESVEGVLARITKTTEFTALGSASFIVEAVKEDSEVKRSVYEKLNQVVSDDCVVVSNTSTIPITELSLMNKNPQKFAGLHFFNPPAVMPIVEIIRGEKTNDSTLLKIKVLSERLKKESVIVNKDIPGFLVNRLNDRMILEALILLQEGAEPMDIDSMARFRLGFPMGICELLDFVGIDTVYFANREMIKHGFNTRPSKILEEMVNSGRTGMKSGRGFYTYPTPNVYVRPTIQPGKKMYRINPVRILASVINEAAWMIRNNVASNEDIERAMKKGMNWPHGPLELADRFGIEVVVNSLKSRLALSGESRYIPDPLLMEMIEKKNTGMRSGTGFFHWETSTTQFESLRYLRIVDFALISINRPERLNALNENVWKELALAMKTALDDDAVRNVFITGNGRAFSAGDDISMMAKWEKIDDAKDWMATYAKPLVDLMIDFPKPIITLVNGLAFGGGCELNMLADIVVASDDAIFSIPEGSIGAIPPIASSIGLANIDRRILRYALTGESLSPGDAQDLGLVDIVVPPDQLSVVMVELSEKLSRIAPLSSRKIKEAANSIKQAQAVNIRAAEEALTELTGTTDFKEGQKAFLKKRSPIWKGK